MTTATRPRPQPQTYQRLPSNLPPYRPSYPRGYHGPTSTIVVSRTPSPPQTTQPVLNYHSPASVSRPVYPYMYTYPKTVSYSTPVVKSVPVAPSVVPAASATVPVAAPSVVSTVAPAATVPVAATSVPAVAAVAPTVVSSAPSVALPHSVQDHYHSRRTTVTRYRVPVGTAAAAAAAVPVVKRVVRRPAVPVYW